MLRRKKCMINKLLYLTYISLENTPTSGSSVRPQKMREALNELDIEVKTFGGANNNIKQRKKTVAEINKLLDVWKPNACYIEPPSGPMFFHGDIALIKRLHRSGIPISIFYRDAYWKYPEFSQGKKLTFVEKIKRFIVKRLQVYQWKVFRNNIDLIYFPSLAMAEEFDCPKKDSLPPGGFLADVTSKEKTGLPLQFIFVGGASKNYGTYLTIDAFHVLNASSVKAKLIYVCPREQWNALGIDKKDYEEWLEVIHVSGDDDLKPLYERADAALLIAPRSFYRDFATPIKIYEYISYLKPIIVTDCTETARIIRDNHVGWVTKDDLESIVDQLRELCDHPEEILKVSHSMDEVRSNNLWSRRAEKVIRDFEIIQENTEE